MFLGLGSLCSSLGLRSRPIVGWSVMHSSGLARRMVDVGVSENRSYMIIAYSTHSIRPQLAISKGKMVTNQLIAQRTQGFTMVYLRCLDNPVFCSSSRTLDSEICWHSCNFSFFNLDPVQNGWAFLRFDPFGCLKIGYPTTHKPTFFFFMWDQLILIRSRTSQDGVGIFMCQELPCAATLG